MRGLYIHIPFCKHICSYCDFHKMVSSNERIDLYIDYLLKEFDLYSNYYKSVKTIYIGGGTPNILSDYNLERILKKIDSLNINPIEYTIEINPELLTLNQVKLFNKYKINRVSIGAESFNDRDLNYLGRHHTKKDIINAINMLKNNNINNINIDIIYGHPKDTIDNIKETINIVNSLNIPHISLYSLILEENTVFYHKFLKNEFKPLDDDIVADMMEYINKSLKTSGYKHYEISNYSKEGYESKHNLLYWSMDEYIGLGLGASGFLDNVRYDNHTNFKDYINAFKKESIPLSIKDLKSEFFILGLRKLNGVNINDYKNKFKSDPFKEFNIDKLIKECLLEYNNNILKLTERGYMLGNIVFEEFI